jgi:hypothetical protein
VLSPELLIKLRELLEYLPGGLAFEELGDLRDRNLRWHGDKQMNVVFGNMTTDNLYLVGLTDFSDEISDSGTNSARQYWLMVFGCPYQVVFTVKDGMAASAV